MRKNAFISIYSASGEDDTFVGCGVLVEPGYALTCAHVLRDALADRGEVWVRLPFVSINGEQFSTSAEVVFDGHAVEASPLDVALLRLKTPAPQSAPHLQLALEPDLEQGEAVVLAYLASRGLDDEIEGRLASHINGKGKRKFTAAVAHGYFVEDGSSGSPVFIKSGQQLAGILAKAEQGEAPQQVEIREGFVVPASLIRPVLDKLSLQRLSPLSKRSPPLRSYSSATTPTAPVRPADLTRFASASGSVIASQPRPGTNDERQIHEVVARVTFRGLMRASIEAGEIAFGYAAAELAIACPNGRLIEPAFVTPVDDQVRRVVTAVGPSRDGAEVWEIIAPQGKILKGDVFALERDGEAEARVASADVSSGDRPELKAHLTLSLRVEDLDFSASSLTGSLNRAAKQAVLTALLVKHERELTHIDLETPA